MAFSANSSQRFFNARLLPTDIRELKQQRRRLPRKRHWKSKVALLQTVSRLVHLVQFLKCWQLFLELNSKRLYQSSGKEKESCCLVFPSSTKREIRHFHVVVVQRRLRNVQKSVMHVQSCYFVNLNPLLFCRSRCRRCRCLSSLSMCKGRWLNVTALWRDHLNCLWKKIKGVHTYAPVYEDTAVLKSFLSALSIDTMNTPKELPRRHQIIFIREH